MKIVSQGQVPAIVATSVLFEGQCRLQGLTKELLRDA